VNPIPILTELLIILAVTTPLVFVFQKLRQPPLVGFLLAGVLLGPSVSGLVQDKHLIAQLSELGVIFLLFTIGLEFPFSSLKHLRKPMLIGGSLQVFITTFLVWALHTYFGWKSKEAFALGMLMALSSTAIVLKILQERREVDSPYGKMTIGILLFQDIVVVPMVLVMQLLGEGVKVPFSQAFLFLSKVLVVVGGLWWVLRALLVPVLTPVVRWRHRELFSLFVLFFCLGIAWVTKSVGLSYALGAFLAGLLLADSEYSHEVMTEISPIKNILFSLFYILLK